MTNKLLHDKNREMVKPPEIVH